MPLKLRGQITPDHRLEVELPPHVQPGEVEVMIEYTETWTDAELEALHTSPSPQTSAEILAWLRANPPMGWEQVEDSAAWVEEERRRQAQARRW
jgi:hypothetical protein